MDVQVKDIDTLMMWNNIFAGKKTGGFLIGNPSVLDTSHNLINDNIGFFKFYDPDNFDYHINYESSAVGAGSQVTTNVRGFILTPVFEYDPDTEMKMRDIIDQIDIGAYENDFINSLRDKETSQIEIYPNPSRDYIIIKLNHNSIQSPSFESLYIYNSLGQLIYQEDIDPKTLSYRINLENYSDGFYYIKINTKNRTITKTFTVLK